MLMSMRDCSTLNQDMGLSDIKGYPTVTRCDEQILVNMMKTTWYLGGTRFSDRLLKGKIILHLNARIDNI